MHGMQNRKGVRHEDLRSRLHDLGRKARRDPKSLTPEDLEEICTLTFLLKPAKNAESAEEFDD